MLEEDHQGLSANKEAVTGSLTETALIITFSAGSADSRATIIITSIDVVKTRIMQSAAGNDSGIDAKEKVGGTRAKGQTGSSVTSEKSVTRKFEWT